MPDALRTLTESDCVRQIPGHGAHFGASKLCMSSDHNKSMTMDQGYGPNTQTLLHYTLETLRTASLR